MQTDRNIQKIGLINLVVLLAAGLIAEVISRDAGSAAGQVGAVFLGLGLLVAAVSYFQMRLETRERLEKLEFDELKKAPAGTGLFSEETETFPARRSREQFEKYFVPAFTILLLCLQAGAAYWIWRGLEKVAPPNIELSTRAMAQAAITALGLFLLGKYSAGRARLEDQPLLRPAASYLLLGAVINVLVAATLAAVWFGFTRLDYYLACALVVVLALTALENLFSLVFEIYRPRIKGQTVRLLYESRLIGLLGHPGGLITTAAQALDYQFGFKVSQTWIYQFLERALAWIILLQLGVLFLSTTVIIIEQNETGLLERFGRPVTGRNVLEPGLHFKWPWPIDQVYRYQTREIQTFKVGMVLDKNAEQDKTVLWTRPHYTEEFNMLVASGEQSARPTTNDTEVTQAVPVNLLAVSVPVQYRITNVIAWAYQHASAATFLEELATREIVHYLVSVDIDNIMTAGRMAAARDLHSRIQQRALESDLGVEIVFVGLQEIHPPTKVADAYEAVIGAMQEKETNILAAEAYALENLPGAVAEATNILNLAASYSAGRIVDAAARSNRFINQIQAYQASPSVYTQRVFLTALGRSLANTRKIVTTTTNTHNVILLNLEDKISPDMLNIK